MPVMFVNYRVQEQPGYATLVHRELAQRFGQDSVFLAASSIRAGDDYVHEVFDNLRQCEVVLALIGPRWLEFSDRGGEAKPRVDWVRREIAEAFTKRIRVIPVLIEDAELPAASRLPADIAALSRCQGVRLRHYSIESDISQLIEELRRTIPALGRRVKPDPVQDANLSLFHYTRAATSACRIGVATGTIRRVRSADMWVNSENTDMQMARHAEFSVSAIIRYWGSIRDESGRVVDDRIADELSRRVSHPPVTAGTAVVTGAGSLLASNNVRHIIHVAAVQGEPGAGFRQVHNIGLCVTNALDQAEKLAERDPAVRTVLIPPLGTGTGGAAIEPTLRTMLFAALDHLEQRPDTLLRGIYFLAYDEREKLAFDDILRTLPVKPVDA